MKKYYKILEISEDSSEGEIKKAYRSLSLKWHPDKYDQNPQRHPANSREEAEEKFKKIKEAFEILSKKDQGEQDERAGEEWECERCKKKFTVQWWEVKKWEFVKSKSRGLGNGTDFFYFCSSQCYCGTGGERPQSSHDAPSPIHCSKCGKSGKKSDTFKKKKSSEDYFCLSCFEKIPNCYYCKSKKCWYGRGGYSAWFDIEKTFCSANCKKSYENESKCSNGCVSPGEHVDKENGLKYCWRCWNPCLECKSTQAKHFNPEYCSSCFIKKQEKEKKEFEEFCKKLEEESRKRRREWEQSFPSSESSERPPDYFQEESQSFPSSESSERPPDYFQEESQSFPSSESSERPPDYFQEESQSFPSSESSERPPSDISSDIITIAEFDQEKNGDSKKGSNLLVESQQKDDFTISGEQKLSIAASKAIESIKEKLQDQKAQLPKEFNNFEEMIAQEISAERIARLQAKIENAIMQKQINWANDKDIKKIESKKIGIFLLVCFSLVTIGLIVWQLRKKRS